MSSEEPSEGITSDMRLCRMCLMAVIVFAFGKEALMFIQRHTSILIMGDTPEPCHKCGWKLRRTDCATIEDGITHCICYNCGMEWVE